MTFITDLNTRIARSDCLKQIDMYILKPTVVDAQNDNLLLVAWIIHRIIHTTAFVILVVKQWLEQVIAQ